LSGFVLHAAPLVESSSNGKIYEGHVEVIGFNFDDGKSTTGF
jgi:hypothetical protein